MKQFIQNKSNIIIIALLALLSVIAIFGLVYYNGKLNEMSEKIEAVTIDNEVKAQEIEILSNTIDKQIVEAEQKDKVIAENTAKIEQLRTIRKNNDAKITQLRDIRKQNEAKLTAKDQQIREKNGSVAYLDNKNDALANENQLLKEEIDRLKK